MDEPTKVEVTLTTAEAEAEAEAEMDVEVVLATLDDGRVVLVVMVVLLGISGTVLLPDGDAAPLTPMVGDSHDS